MLLECHNCGAPLDVASGASTVKCAYCGQSARTERYKTVAFETPKDFAPPKEWRPPPEAKVSAEVLVFKPVVKAATAIVRMVVTAALFTAGLGAFIAYKTTMASSSVSSAAIANAVSQMAGMNDTVKRATEAAARAGQAAVKAASEASSAGITAPYRCDGNDDVTITNRTLSLPGGTPVVAAGNCTLRLVGCTLSGASGLVVQSNAEVFVEGGSITGTAQGIAVSGNGAVHASSGAVIKGEPALGVTSNGKADLRGASVSGKRAIVASGNANVDTDGATILGSTSGVRKRR